MVPQLEATPVGFDRCDVCDIEALRATVDAVAAALARHGAGDSQGECEGVEGRVVGLQAGREDGVRVHRPTKVKNRRTAVAARVQAPGGAAVQQVGLARGRASPTARGESASASQHRFQG